MDISNEWANQGQDDRLAHSDAVPAFLEVAPDSFRPVDDCSPTELVAAADSKMLQAKMLMEEAGRLYKMATGGKRASE